MPVAGPRRPDWFKIVAIVALGSLSRAVGAVLQQCREALAKALAGAAVASPGLGEVLDGRRPEALFGAQCRGP